jgi:choline dehydrogenase-like flavoprotein
MAPRRHVSARYDYVVTGGGTAGCVLAGRLAENPSMRVLLIEAGRRDNHALIHIPAGFPRLAAGSYQWGHVSRPQRHCCDRSISLVQGKVLGGGGSINAQVFTRGVPDDFDRWSQMYGCSGWSGRDTAHLFVRSESNVRLSAPMHGTEGPLVVSDPALPHALSQAFVKAGQEFGLPYNHDFNGTGQGGVGFYQTTTQHGRRCSAVAYLRDHGSNLQVLTSVQVQRIVLEGKRAIGVEYRGADGMRVVHAEREVILTAGAFGSPRLLQLSGIGDPADLKAAGIETLHALPGVGKNLHDHYAVDLVYRLRTRQGMDRYNRVRVATAVAGLQYLAFRTGPLASTLVEAGAFAIADPHSRLPDLQFHFLPASGRNGVGGSALDAGSGATLNSYVLRPLSRGFVRVRTADPSAALVIDPNFLADPQDVEIGIRGLRLSQEIMDQPSMAKHTIGAHLEPGSSLATEDDHVRFIRRYGRSACHPVGTCAMGVSDQSVVSPRLAVHGLEGLRVADSSVMPSIVSSNTLAPTVMIAEKAADLIRAVA